MSFFTQEDPRPLDLTADVAIPVNLTGALGGGVANLVARAYPDYVDPYRADLESGRLRDGTVTAWQTPGGNHVLSVPVRRRWTEPPEPELVQTSIHAMLETARGLGINRLHTVALGCDPGVLDWRRDVEPILRQAAYAYLKLDVIVHL